MFYTQNDWCNIYANALTEAPRTAVLVPRKNIFIWEISAPQSLPGYVFVNNLNLAAPIFSK